MLEKYNTINSKLISTLFTSHFKLNYEQCPISKEDKEDMQNIVYASIVGSLMHIMTCTRPNISQMDIQEKIYA